MDRKKTNNKNKKNINKKLILVIGALLVLIAIILISVMTFKSVNVGKINKDGKAEYIERVVNVTKYSDKKIVEFKNDYELIDNGIITTEIYNKLKDNDSQYNLTVAEYLNQENISAKESYNINKALQLGIVTENTRYA